MLRFSFAGRKIIKSFIFSLVLLSLFFLPLSPVYAQSIPCGVVDETVTLEGISCYVEKIISLALGLTGIVLFVMFIVGGFKYLTAGGDPKAAESARNTLTYALLGFVLIIASTLILKFIGLATGVDLTNFNIIYNLR